MIRLAFYDDFYDGPRGSATSAEAADSLCRTILNGRYNKVWQHYEPLFYLNPGEPFLLLEGSYTAAPGLPIPIWQVLYKQHIGWIMAGQHSYIGPFIQ